MRNIAFIFAAFIMLFTSCSSDDNSVFETQNQPVQGIKLNINVSEPSADQTTRAFVKTGWSKDDVIQIWFGNNVQDFKNDGGSYPDLVIKYNGSNWVVDDAASLSGKLDKGVDYTSMKSVYNGNVKVASVDNCTYNSTTKTLTADIKTWKYLTQVQVVVTGISEAVNYKLACDRFFPCSGFKTEAEKISATYDDANVAVDGIANTDGVAFVFGKTNIETTASYTFTLYDYANGTTKSYTVSGKTLEMSDTKIYGLKLSSTKFNAVQNEQNSLVGVGVATRNDGTSVKWIQLWENGPKFAEYNVGATRDTEYGNYYTWGGIVDMASYSYDKESYTAPSYKSTGNVSLSGSDDTAYELWGSNWRMITEDEFKDLIAFTIKSTTTGYGSNKVTKNDTTFTKCVAKWEVKDGVLGCTFSGLPNTAYAQNSVFFPAAGSYFTELNANQRTSGCGKTGFYWSSNPKAQTNGSVNATADAKYMQVSGNILSTGAVSGFSRVVSEMGRNRGASVRAVLKE